MASPGTLILDGLNLYLHQSTGLVGN